jgi:hypothetical protein
MLLIERDAIASKASPDAREMQLLKDRRRAIRAVNRTLARSSLLRAARIDAHALVQLGVQCDELYLAQLQVGGRVQPNDFEGQRRILERPLASAGRMLDAPNPARSMRQRALEANHITDTVEYAEKLLVRFTRLARKYLDDEVDMPRWRPAAKTIGTMLRAGATTEGREPDPVEQRLLSIIARHLRQAVLAGRIRQNVRGVWLGLERLPMRRVAIVAAAEFQGLSTVALEKKLKRSP